ncbi:MAG: (2Fe-2S)-binding protein [Desulfobacterales bacterium]
MNKENPDKTQGGGRKEFSRRQFFTTVGAGAVAIAVSGHMLGEKAQSAGAAGSETTESMTAVILDINGHPYRLLVEPRWSLLFVIREKLGLTATKVGCERGECGACTVLLDDIPHYACLTLAVEAEGRKITTLEGLMDAEKLGSVQQAFLEKDAYQCGYCTPGQIMAVEGLLREKPQPSAEEIRTGVSGNLCRCGAYVNIFSAAQYAAELKWNR